MRGLDARPCRTVLALSVNRRVAMPRSSADVNSDCSCDLYAMGGPGIDGAARGVLPAGGPGARWCSGVERRDPLRAVAIGRGRAGGGIPVALGVIHRGGGLA